MCTIDGCQKKLFARGMCSMHYSRVRKWGDPNRRDKPGLPPGSKGTPVQRVLEKVEKLPGGCWRFTGATNEHGYGIIRNAGRNTRAHIVTWTAKNGPVPEGKELDHFRFPKTCIGPACCNPRHVRPETHRVNSLRSDSPTAINARKRKCNRGHPLTGDNVRRRGPNKRECKTCARDLQRQRKEGAK